MLSFGDLRLGTVISINDEPYQIVFTQHIKVARGGAVVKTKLKNLISGSTLEKNQNFKIHNQYIIITEI